MHVLHRPVETAPLSEHRELPTLAAGTPLIENIRFSAEKRLPFVATAAIFMPVSLCSKGDLPV
jgi:hypothetical protein